MASIVTPQMFMVIGKVGAHPCHPVQPIQGASCTFGGAVLDVRVIGMVTPPPPREADRFVRAFNQDQPVFETLSHATYISWLPFGAPEGLISLTLMLAFRNEVSPQDI